MVKNFLIIFFVCLTLIVIWFKEGFILGTAEAVLPFYNLERYFKLTEYAWTFHPGLGNFSGTTTASKPTYFFLSYMQNIGVPGFILQALTFFFILLSGAFGMYFLTRQIFPKLPERFYLFSALFYLFNPITLVNVWNRFLPNFMFFYALLPISLFIFNKGLSQKKYYYAVLLSVALFFYSFAFSALVFVILLWMTLGLFCLFYFLISKSSNERLFIVKYLLIGLAFFILTNIWYLTQLLNFTSGDSFQSTVRTFHSQRINIDTLNSLSQKMGNLSDLYRLNNSWFINEVDLDWIKAYHTNPVIIMGLLSTTIVLFGIINGRKQKSVLLLTFVFFAALFLSKGTSPPLGFVYGWVFEYLPFLQVLRNPIEKFSFILIVVYAPLLSFGLYKLSNNFSGKITLFFAISLLILWSYPFFTTLVLTNPYPPNNTPEVGFKVEVPPYYEQANKFLKSHGNNFRVIGFPVADEGITYLWKKGYQGADIPSTLFDMPVIMFNTTVPYYYDLVKEIETSLNSEKNFTKIANLLNVRFLLLREDVDFKARKLSNPNDLEKVLNEKEKSKNIKKVVEIGKLKIWENKNWVDLTFYPANTLIATKEAKLADLADLKNGQVLFEGKKNFENLNSLPRITYQKINPAQYILKIENASSPFILVFSETYNPNWQAISNNQIFDNHFRVNLYANAWEINRTGSYEIEVKFIPQDWFEKTQLTSLFGYALGCTYLLFFRRKA